MGQEFVVPSFNTNRYYNKNTDQIATLPVGATAGSVMFVGSDGTLDEDNANFFWDDTNNILSLGDNTPDTASGYAMLQVTRAFVNGVAEKMAKFSLSEDTSSFMEILNASATNAALVPELRGTQSSISAGLVLRGVGTTDTGSNPIVFNDARIGASTAVSTRPTFGWYNNLTEQMQITGGGLVSINRGSASVAYRFSVYGSGSDLTSGSMLAHNSSDNSSASTVLNLKSGTSDAASGFIGAFHGAYGTTTYRNKVVIANNSDATGIVLAATGASGELSFTVNANQVYYATASTGQTIIGPVTASSTDTLVVARNAGDSSYGLLLRNTSTAGYGCAINWEVAPTAVGAYVGARLDVQNTGANGGGYLAFLACPAASTTLAEVARLYNDTFLIGRTSGTLSDGILQVRALASASASETIARFDVSDDTSSYITFSNGTASDSSFIPVISGVQSGTLQGLFLTAQVTTDTGTNPALALHARVGAGTIVATRPAFQFRNHTTTIGGFTGSTAGSVFIVGGNTLTAYGRLGQRLEVNASANFGGAALNAWSTTGSEGPALDFNHSKSATVGTQTIVADDDRLGILSFRGSDGTAFISGAVIEGFVDGTPGTNDMPGRLVFSTAADGAATVTEAMRISSRRNVLVGLGAIAEPSTSVGTLALFNGATAPTTSVDAVSLYAVDLSAGNATLGLFTETAVAVDAAVASTHTLTIKINGTNYRVLLAT